MTGYRVNFVIPKPPKRRHLFLNGLLIAVAAVILLTLVLGCGGPSRALSTHAAPPVPAAPLVPAAPPYTGPNTTVSPSAGPQDTPSPSPSPSPSTTTTPGYGAGNALTPARSEAFVWMATRALPEIQAMQADDAAQDYPKLLTDVTAAQAYPPPSSMDAQARHDWNGAMVEMAAVVRAHIANDQAAENGHHAKALALATAFVADLKGVK